VCEHAEIRKQVLNLRDRSDEDSWALADTLIQVFNGSYYKLWGFTNWTEYVTNELDFTIRKAQYLIRTQEWLTKLPKNVQVWIRQLGWRKARMLVGIVTAENAAEWKARIGTECSTMQLDEMLHQNAVEAANDPDGKGADAGSERQPNYNLGRPNPQQRQNMDRAEERAAVIAECEQTKDRKAYLWDLIATDFLATNSGIRTVQEYLSKIETTLGLKLIAIDDRKGLTVIHGAATLDLFADSEDEEEEEGEDVVDPGLAAVDTDLAASAS
jgi:hypothetical protein